MTPESEYRNVCFQKQLHVQHLTSNNIWTSGWSPTDGSLWTSDECGFDFPFSPEEFLFVDISVQKHHHKFVGCCTDSEAQH